MIAQKFCDFLQKMPDQAVLTGALLGLCILPLERKFISRIISLALVSAIVCIITQYSNIPENLGNLYCLFLGGLAFLDFFMWRNLTGPHFTEKKIFVLFWAISGHLLIVQDNWLTFYLGMEMVTLPFYALTALSSHPQALEGTLKYFTANACFSVLWLFSLSLVWTGAEGFVYQSINLSGPEGSFFIMMSCFLIALKMGVFPCAYWAPDLYQISSRATIVWMSFVPKYLAIVVCSRFLEAFTLNQPLCDVLLVGIVLGTLWGHFGAIFQNNIQRFLGYSAAAQVGFFLSPLFVQGLGGLNSALIYLVIYTLSLLFFVYGLQRSFLENKLVIMGRSGRNVIFPMAYFSGLLSLAGLPPFPGFFAKIYVLMMVIEGNKHIALAVFLGLSNLIALFYYTGWIFKTRGNIAPSSI